MNVFFCFPRLLLAMLIDIVLWNCSVFRVECAHAVWLVQWPMSHGFLLYLTVFSADIVNKTIEVQSKFFVWVQGTREREQFIHTRTSPMDISVLCNKNASNKHVQDLLNKKKNERSIETPFLSFFFVSRFFPLLFNILTSYWSRNRSIMLLCVFLC